MTDLLLKSCETWQIDIPMQQGQVFVPSGPGLGIKVDESKVRALAAAM